MITVDVEGKQVEFPDGTHPVIIERAIKAHFYPQKQPSTTSQMLNAPQKEYTTGLGHILNAVGWPEERMRAVLTEPRRALRIGQEMGMYSPKPPAEVESENRILGTVGKGVASLIPYKSSIQGAVLGQIGPVYHGSPYKFTKFENKAIGTGEGAQAFGHGHYLSEVPEVGKSYAMAKGVKLGDLEITPKSMWFDPLNRVVRGEEGWNEKTITKSLEDTIANWGKESRIGKESGKILEKIKLGEKPTEGGNLYEATIHKGKQPSEYTFLEWDKPLKDQPQNVKNAIKKLGIDFNAEYPGLTNVKFEDRLGSLLYDALGQGEMASKRLREVGISGIKYPTGSLSGMKDTGKYNYVVFNPENITIEKIGGKAVVPRVETGTSVSVRGKQGVINEVNPDGTVSVGFRDGSMAEVRMNDITVGTERRAVK